MEILETLPGKFEQFEKTLNGSASGPAHAERKLALSQLLEKGFPGRKTEDYKFTPLTKTLEKNFSGSGEESSTYSLDKKLIEQHLLTNVGVYNIIMINGVLHQELSTIPSDFNLISLKEAFTKFPDETGAHFGKHSNESFDPFVAWNTAFSEQGLFIKVEKNKVVDKPVMIYYFNTADGDNETYQSRSLIIAEEGAQLKLAEIYVSEGTTNSFSNVVSEIVVDRNASVELNRVQNDHENSYHFGHTQVYQERDSNFTASTITLQGAMIRNNISIRQNGENCESHMYGLYVLEGKSHVDNHTTVDHIHPNSFSNELYKGIMDDRSKGVFNGRIFVRKEAQKTNAFQSNNNILLSDNATINTKPQLEIWADDVKCSHGCTIGQLDEEAIFYLRSRAIGETEAKAMLLYAFANDTLDKITIAPLKEYLDTLLSKRLLTNG